MNERRKSPVAKIALAACGLVFSVTGLAPVAVAAQDREEPPAFTIEGEVLDAATGVPVEAAIVTVIGQSVSDVSNQLGYFRLEEIPAGSYAVRVLRLGYQTLEEGVSIDGEEVLTIHLTPGPVPLRGIEVEVITRGDYDLRSVGIASHGLIGPAEAHVEKLKALEAAGVTQFTLYLMTEEQERLVGEYATRVMPHLR